jgi:hypothetical protein
VSPVPATLRGSGYFRTARLGETGDGVGNVRFL